MLELERERERERRKRTRLFRGRGCHGRTRRVFREPPAVYNGALVPPVSSLSCPSMHPPLPLHTAIRARTLARARDRSPSSYLTALVRPAGRPAKLRKPVLLKNWNRRFVDGNTLESGHGEPYCATLADKSATQK